MYVLRLRSVLLKLPKLPVSAPPRWRDAPLACRIPAALSGCAGRFRLGAPVSTTWYAMRTPSVESSSSRGAAGNDCVSPVGREREG